jgi:hypothetical protein
VIASKSQPDLGSLPGRAARENAEALGWPRFRVIVSVIMNDIPQAEDLASLYQRAFRDYGARALWNMRPVADPTPAAALAITQALRTHGRMEGRRLAERIEQLCRADQ